MPLQTISPPFSRFIVHTPRQNEKSGKNAKNTNSTPASEITPDNATIPENVSVTDADLKWLEDATLAARVRNLFARNLRIPQEAIGWEFLSKH